MEEEWVNNQHSNTPSTPVQVSKKKTKYNHHHHQNAMHGLR